MRRRCVSLLGACALTVGALAVVATSPAAAQTPAAEEGGASAKASSSTDGSHRGGGGSRGPMLIVLRIAEALQLNDEQTVKVASEFRRVAQQRRTLLADKAALEAKLAGQLERKPVDEAALSSSTGELVRLERELVLLPDQLWKAIDPILTVEQRARLLLLRGKLKKQVDGERRSRLGRGRNR